MELLGEAHWLKPPTLARHHRTICMSCFMTGDPDKEYTISHHQPEEFGKGQKETPCVRPLPRIPLTSIHLGWAMRAPPGKTQLEWLAKDHMETNPITIKPETVSHAAEQFSWVPLPYCSPPGCPFPIKSLALSAHVSPQIIHFQVLDKSPVSGPGRGPPSCNRTIRKTKFTGIVEWALAEIGKFHKLWGPCFVCSYCFHWNPDLDWKKEIQWDSVFQPCSVMSWVFWGGRREETDMQEGSACHPLYHTLLTRVLPLWRCWTALKESI